MKRPERNFREQLKRNLIKLGRKLHIQPIENTATVGTPDLNICVEPGIESWNELKAWERIRLTGRFTVPKLREEQALWLSRRASLGSRSYLLCRINKDVVLIDGRFTPALFDKSLSLEWSDAEKIATVWLKYPVRWGDLLDALCSIPMSDTAIEAKLKLFKARK